MNSDDWFQQITADTRAELEVRARCPNAATFKATKHRDQRLRRKRFLKRRSIAEERARCAAAVAGGAHDLD